MKPGDDAVVVGKVVQIQDVNLDGSKVKVLGKWIATSQARPLSPFEQRLLERRRVAAEAKADLQVFRLIRRIERICNKGKRRT